MSKSIISTPDAPAAIGTYSQAVTVSAAAQTVYLSGQIPLIPESMEMVSEDFTDQAHQVFKNLIALAAAAGAQDGHFAKLNIYLIDLANFQTVNEVMAQYFSEPYPARAAVQVSALPKGAKIEIDAVLSI